MHQYILTQLFVEIVQEIQIPTRLATLQTSLIACRVGRASDLMMAPA